MAEKIRQFFKKKKVNQDFKSAGPGHRLTEEPPQRYNKLPIVSQPTSSRGKLSEGALRAGEAAVARLQQQHHTPNWSQAAIRAQARKEFELEIQAKEKVKYEAPKLIMSESSSILAVSGIYFNCPLIGPDVLPYHELEAKIKEFLYEQLSEERSLTACLIIYTCNKDKEKVKAGVETICRYLRNIIDNPQEEKYRKIRVNNRIFQEKVASLEGSWDFMIGAGFQEQMLEKDGIKETYLVFPEENLENIDTLQTLVEALWSVEPIVPILDRSIRVLMPAEATAKFNLPNDFYSLTIEELKREQEEREHKAELVTQLRTKAMRERDEIRERRRYKYSLIRIRLPDGIVLQGTFYANENLGDVKEFLSEHLADPTIPYILHAPGGEKLAHNDDILADLHLVPAAMINLSYSNENALINLTSSSKSEHALRSYLKKETMALIQNM